MLAVERPALKIVGDLGVEQGYNPLPVARVRRFCEVQDMDVPSMISAWMPDDKELELLNKGYPVHVSVDGFIHPPICLFVTDGPVVEVVEEESEVDSYDLPAEALYDKTDDE